MYIFQDFEGRFNYCPISAGFASVAQFDLCGIDLNLGGGRFELCKYLGDIVI